MSQLPLEGIRILDLSQVWAGPLSSRILADMGAEVIHVEACQRIDTMRYQFLADNEIGERPWERGRGGLLHRNKYGITLNLNDPRALDMIKRLIKMSDVVMENFSPRVMKNFGLAYPQLRDLKPSIIMISMSAFGQTGPYHDFIGMGTVMQAVGGLSNLAGYPDGMPMDVDATLSDPLSGLYGAGAILTALRYRDRTGEGQYIDLSQTETATTVTGGQVMDYTINGRTDIRMGNRHPWMAPHGVYRCKGEDRWVAIAVRSEKEWRDLCKVIGNPSWVQEERFAAMQSRWENQDELDKRIEQWTIRLDHYTVMKRLQKAGVPAGALLTNKEVLFDEQIKARGFFKRFDHPEIGRRPVPGMAFRLTKTPGSLRKTSPLMGEDNEYIFTKLLGLSKEELNQLTADEVIGNAPIPFIPPADMVPASTFQAWNILAGYDSDYRAQVEQLYEGDEKVD